MGLTLTLLGGFDARVGDGPPLTFARKKAQALLAYLALTPERAQPRDKLAALLWGEMSTDAARHNLRQALLAIRQVVPPKTLAADTDVIALAGHVSTDVAEFTRLLAAGDSDALAAAADLYRGDLLAGIGAQSPAFEEWLLAERARLHELAIEGLARLLAHQTRRDLVDAAIGTAIRLIAIDPLQEPVHRVLMRLYARQGRRGDALRQYQACVAAFQRDLGVEPERETQGLYQEILRAPDTRSVEPRVAVTPVLAGDHAAPFLGRDAERAQLRDALGRAGEGRGQVLVVLGEAGIGKSRLLSELGREAGATGHAVLIGRCHETERMLALGPWSDVLRAALDDATLASLDAGWRTELARLVPEAGTAAPASGDDRRLFAAVVEALHQRARRGRIVLMLEDLHWADEMSLRLFAFLARRIESAAIALVATVRDDEITPSLQTVLDELDRERHAARIALSPLSREDATALAEHLLRTGASAEKAGVAERVWCVSEGNPFVIVETVRALDQRLDALSADSVGVPERVRRTIDARIDRLARASQDVVAVSATIGRQFDFGLLQRATGLSDRDTAAAVEELVRRRILGAVGDRLDFTHDRIREVAYARLVPARRKVLHGAVAGAIETLEAQFTDRLEFHSAVAHHAYESGNLALARAHALEAGRRSADRFAYGDALAHLERARACAAALGVSHAEIDEVAGDVAFQRGRLDAAATTYERARSAAVTVAQRARIDVKLGRVFVQYGDARGPMVLQRALDALDPRADHALIGAAMAMLGRYAHFAGRLREALALLENARRILSAPEHRAALADAYRYAAGAYQHLFQLDESDDAARHAIALADPDSIVMNASVGFLAQCAYCRGRWDASLELNARSLDIARRVGAEHRVAFALHDRGWALYGKGDLAAAADCFRHAMALGDASGERRIGVYSRAWLARAASDLGLAREALDHAGAAAAAADATTDISLRAAARHAVIYARFAQGDAAADLVDDWLALFEQADVVWFKAILGASVAQVLLGAGRDRDATALAIEIIDLAHRRGAPHYEAVARRVLGQIFATRGALGDARRELDAAVTTLDELGSRLELARALRHRGIARSAAGDDRGGDADRSRAASIFEQIGAASELDRGG